MPSLLIFPLLHNWEFGQIQQSSSSSCPFPSFRSSSGAPTDPFILILSLFSVYFFRVAGLQTLQHLSLPFVLSWSLPSWSLSHLLYSLRKKIVNRLFLSITVCNIWQKDEKDIICCSEGWSPHRIRDNMIVSWEFFDYTLEYSCHPSPKLSGVCNSEHVVTLFRAQNKVFR